MTPSQAERFVAALEEQIAHSERLREDLIKQGCEDLARYTAANLTGLRLALTVFRHIQEENGHAP